ncbi:ATP-dependent helicase HrpB [Luteimonas sp. R10]|uniref:ATP-dependent helicase HrpB n=1 Tax=Luteimonas sp. R10 TaxID=3108176 RepID=UPI003087EB5E|nr:ATP-dependent helicase HrpB [Luteimonas sp. R10]
MPASDFPIAPLLPEILRSLQSHPRLVLEAPPGAGKTTRVPLALLAADWLRGRRIVMLEPRRVAARAAAGYMAQQLGEAVGETVGYRIRFDRRVSARTRIEVVTEGILTRMLQDDPLLDGVGALLFDEFHERHLAGDLGLALALDVQAGVREDLRIVAMSATLDGERLARFLDAPRLSSAGRSFPVEVSHFPARRGEASEHQIRRVVEHALREHPGDVLVFLPGRREIDRLAAMLEASLPGRSSDTPAVGGEARGASRQAGHGWPAPESGQGERGLLARHAARPRERPARCAGPDREAALTEGKAMPPEPRPRSQPKPCTTPIPAAIEILALHGDLPVEQQARVLRPSPDGRRRVVLATNVAESSVTLPGVRVVIDSGLAREPRHDPNSGFSRLDVVTIAQASADQRAGRAGRVAAGWAYRLWPQSQRLEPQRRPEIAQVELASLALELAAWGSDALRFPDPPPPGALAAGRDLLHALGALEAGHRISAAGRRMLALGTHPRLAAMLLAPSGDGARALACDLVALLEARDPLRGHSDALAARWQALAAFRGGRVPADVHRGALAAIDAAAAQWRRRLRVAAPPPASVPAHALGDLLAHAFPDRIARQHPQDPYRYQLANGRMARLLDDSALYGEPWLVASELRFEARDALLLRAAPVDEAALRAAFASRFREGEETRWDPARRALVAERVRRFDGIVLDSRPGARVDPQQAARALTDAVRQLGLDALPWSDGLRQWRERVRCLREWVPELGLPDLSDEALLATLDDWLLPAFAGKTRLDALDAPALGEALRAGVDWDLRRRIDTLAPERIAVPSGMQRRIDYAHGAAPVLAVKLQELFGLADTPRIAVGRVPLTLHLLSPAGRPLQVTQDLRSFWERTWPEVRGEMKGRYPKHPWPEDPWNAVPTHRARPRA